MTDLKPINTEKDMQKAIAGMIDEISEGEIKHYYLCGVRATDKGRNLDFLFPYTDSELKAAMMEEIQYNSSSDEERKNMSLEHKQKFSQGFLLASYRKRMNDVKICLFRSEKELTKKKIEEHVLDVDENVLDAAEIPM